MRESKPRKQPHWIHVDENISVRFQPTLAQNICSFPKPFASSDFKNSWNFYVEVIFFVLFAQAWKTKMNFNTLPVVY